MKMGTVHVFTKASRTEVTLKPREDKTICGHEHVGQNQLQLIL